MMGNCLQSRGSRGDYAHKGDEAAGMVDIQLSPVGIVPVLLVAIIITDRRRIVREMCMETRTERGEKNIFKTSLGEIVPPLYQVMFLLKGHDSSSIF
jgi:hypothetical protein